VTSFSSIKVPASIVPGTKQFRIRLNDSNFYMLYLNSIKKTATRYFKQEFQEICPTKRGEKQN